MKKVIYILVLICTNCTISAQVGINRTEVSSVSTLLDFPTDKTDGLILPAVSSAASVAPINGTIIFDRSDARLKYYQAGTWVFLSEGGNAAKAPIENQTQDNATIGVIISDTTSDNALGVLELRSETKAMILPKVANPHLNIPSPVAGTIVYDTISQSVALFDGTVWNYLIEQ